MQSAPPPPAPTGRSWSRSGHTELVAVGGACAIFVALASLRAVQQTYPYFDDVAYLSLGETVRGLGGPLGIWSALLGGRFEESNRHPLYLALLSLFARPDPAYHREAQALSVVLGLVALLSSWSVARRHFGRAPAAVLALLLSVNGTLVLASSRETCEGLLVAVWARAFGAFLDGAAPGPRARFAWWRAGGWAGLAYLTKGSGLFLPAVVGIALFVEVRLRVLLDRRVWAFGTAFAAVSAPLLVRNLRVFGSPIYNLNSRYVWVDRLSDFAETFAPHADDRLPRGALEYFSQLTPRSLLDRVGMGLVETSFHLADVMASVSPTAGGPLHVFMVVLGAVFAVVALRAAYRSPRGLPRTFHLVHAGWTFAFLFVFNANGGSARYFLPLAATTLLPHLALALAAAAASPARSARWPARTAIAWGGAIAGALTAAATPVRPPAGFQEVQGWLLEHLRPGDVYAIDARTHLQPRWLLPCVRQVIVSASWGGKPVPAGELVAYLREKDVRLVVLDGASVADAALPGDPASRRYLFYDLVPKEPDGSLSLAALPPGFRVAYVDPTPPHRWAVLETPWAAAAPDGAGGLSTHGAAGASDACR